MKSQDAAYDEYAANCPTHLPKICSDFVIDSGRLSSACESRVNYYYYYYYYYYYGNYYFVLCVYLLSFTRANFVIGPWPVELAHK
jgi:hypothetical protein